MDIKTKVPYESENALAHIRKCLDIVVECGSSLVELSEDMYVMHRGRKLKMRVEIKDVVDE